MALAVVATLVLVIGLLVVKDRVLEEHYLSRLETTDPDACASAAWNLGRLGSLRAVPRLLWGGNEATWHARQFGLAWIFLQRPAEVFPALATAMKSENASIRELSLSVLTEPVARAYLVRKGRMDRWSWELTTLVGPEGDFKSDVFEGIKDRLLPVVGHALEDRVEDVRKRAAEALGYAGKDGVPFLCAGLKHNDVEVRRNAVSTFYTMYEEARDAAPCLIDVLKDTDGKVRSTAAQALHAIGADASPAVRALEGLLAVEEEPEVQDAVLGALSSYGSAGLPVLLSATKHENRHVRHCAAAILASSHKEYATTVLPILLETLSTNIKAVEGGHAFEDLYHAIWAMESLGPDAALAVPLLEEALRSGAPEIRKIAAMALGSVGEKAAPAAHSLCGLLKDPDESVGKSAAQSLGLIDSGTPEVISALKAVVSDPDAEDDVRTAAEESLQLIGKRPAAA